ncbi:MAG: carbohydrate ABC transporter permease [Actinomycetota bacterium]|nr:carbohydrate ABC transporter permease [Actinomycetota bacterium]
MGLVMTGSELDDGFGDLGPIVGRVMRWIPTWTLLLVTAVWILPTTAAFIASLRPSAFARTSAWWEDLFDPAMWTLEPYRVALDSSANNSFIESVLNSFAIAIPSMLIPLLIASAAAYAIVNIPFRGSGVLFLGMLALIAVPIYGVLIPLLQAFVSGVHWTLPLIDKSVTLLPATGLAGSIPGVWIIHIGSQLPFSIFLLVFAVARVPRSLIDTARVDGASDLQIYSRVVVPLITPALASLGVLLFLWAWNDFIVALTIIGFNAAALPATVRFSAVGTIVDGPVAMSMVFIHASVAIVVFFVLQRYFVRGLLTGTE